MMTYKRKTDLFLIVSLLIWGAMVFFIWIGLAHGASLVVAAGAPSPSSQPAGGLPLDNWSALAKALIDAITGHNWPVVIVSVCIIALGVERHFKGLTGNRFSTWLGTKWGMFASSLFTAVVTAASNVAFQGWKAIGNSCLAAGLAALLNFGVQFAGPATKAAPAAEAEKPAVTPPTPTPTPLPDANADQPKT